MHYTESVHLLFLPGFGGIDKGHWQTIWSEKYPNTHVLQQNSWYEPIYDEWARVLTDYIMNKRSRRIVIVAHSLGTSLSVRWIHTTEDPTLISGLFLVAPSDRDFLDANQEFPRGFGPMITRRISVPTVVLASENDDKVSISRAKYFAESWGSKFVNMGSLGHMGSKANLGEWCAGQNELNKFLSSIF
jgi:uncharacterized protein